MAGMEGFEPSSQGVWSRILDLNQYTVETVFKLIHRILLELILESPLPYRLATPLLGREGWGQIPSLSFCGVGKGTRTLDTRNHNPVL